MTNEELHRQIKAAIDDVGTALVLCRLGIHGFYRARIIKEHSPAQWFTFDASLSTPLEAASDAWASRCPNYVLWCCWQGDKTKDIGAKIDAMVRYQNALEGVGDDESHGWEVYGIDKKGKAWVYEQA